MFPGMRQAAPHARLTVAYRDAQAHCVYATQHFNPSLQRLKRSHHVNRYVFSKHAYPRHGFLGPRPMPSHPSLLCSASKAAAAATAAAAAVAATPVVGPAPPTQDPAVIYHALQAPLLSLNASVATHLGGHGSWGYYLFERFMCEVVAVAAAALLAYWLLTIIARGSVEAGSKRPNSMSGEVFAIAADAMTAPLARGMLAAVLAVNVVRSSLDILDGFITKFNPTLPTDWLDDLVRLMVQGLTPLDQFLMKLSLVLVAVCGCAVAVRWKDILLAHYLLPTVEGLDKGQELVQNFINPASTLVTWVIIVSSIGWLATALGVNLKPLLAVGGASGIIIGLATQQVLGNFVSGLNIYLARPFVPGEYISLIGQALTSTAQLSGRVVRVDPMRTIIATEDSAIIAVPNQIIAVSIVVNRSRGPYGTAGRPNPMLATPRELRWRMKLPHSALDNLNELESKLSSALVLTLPEDKVRFSMSKLMVIKFIETGAEVTGKVNLAWRLGSIRATTAASDLMDRREKQEELMQAALLALQKVVRKFDGSFLSVA